MLPYHPNIYMISATLPAYPFRRPYQTPQHACLPCVQIEGGSYVSVCNPVSIRQCLESQVQHPNVRIIVQRGLALRIDNVVLSLVLEDALSNGINEC